MAEGGTIYRISGSTVEAAGLLCARMYDVTRVGGPGIMGEVIRIHHDLTTIQVYEDTSGLSVGEPVICAGHPLTVELGPGLLGQVFDGIQRPLLSLKEVEGDFILRGTDVRSLDTEREWEFTAVVSEGQEVTGGDVLGTVPEGGRIVHRIMVPPDVAGRVREARSGTFRVDDTVVRLDTGSDGMLDLSLVQRWPVRIPRPCVTKIAPDRPFLTGQRVLDTLFPIALGGTAIVPGGFGTGKTVVEQTLAKHADADVIIYIGCGERGNEMTEVLTEFPKLEDPQTGRSLMERTVLVVNTSNMPVAAREASIYTGITMAEYFRDMGYHVALMADSTSRWAEALREISSRLEEMPGEEGYPTYMGTRLAGFYERAGHVRTLGSDEHTGSVTIVSAVSPPGGDFSEPVTQGSMRIAGGLWALDTSLAHRRHYPAISWTRSYSLYGETLAPWFARETFEDWAVQKQRLNRMLEREKEIQEMVQLVGEDAIPDNERVLLLGARLIRENFLRQNAYHPVDASCSLMKQYWMLKAFLDGYETILSALGTEIPLEKLLELTTIVDLARLNEQPDEKFPEASHLILKKLKAEIEELAGEMSRQREKFEQEEKRG
ncbi:MAG: V-type ATP synthase subunit A [bacterium]|nr:V-type ATP synthase subunit A [bacterium]MDT8396413.1 V-type ATP synthase subunit A [bacterium]